MLAAIRADEVCSRHLITTQFSYDGAAVIDN